MKSIVKMVLVVFVWMNAAAISCVDQLIFLSEEQQSEREVVLQRIAKTYAELLHRSLSRVVSLSDLKAMARAQSPIVLPSLSSSNAIPLQGLLQLEYYANKQGIDNKELHTTLLRVLRKIIKTGDKQANRQQERRERHRVITNGRLIQDSRPPMEVFISKDRKTLVTLGVGSFHKLDLKTGTLKEELKFPTYGSPNYKEWQILATAPDGSSFIQTKKSQYSDTDLAFLRLADDYSRSDVLMDFPGHESSVWGASYSPDGKHAITLSNDKYILWDLYTGKAIQSGGGMRRAMYTKLSFGLDFVLATDTYGNWNSHWVLKQTPLEYHLVLDAPVKSVAISRAHNFFAVGLTNGWVTIDGPKTERRKFLAHRTEVTAVALSPDGKTFATGGFDGSIRLLETNTWSLLDRFDGGQRDISSLKFDEEGQVLVSASLDQSIRIWDLNFHE